MQTTTTSPNAPIAASEPESKCENKTVNRETDIEVIGPADEMDEFYVRWAFESIRDNIKTANDSLQRVGGFAMALLGGGLLGLAAKYVQPNWALASCALFILTALAALTGSIPEVRSIRPLVPNDTKRHKERLLTWKVRFLGFAIAMLLLGLITVTIGVVVQARLK
jgi:hypothetical protein